MPGHKGCPGNVSKVSFNPRISPGACGKRLLLCFYLQTHSVLPFENAQPVQTKRPTTRGGAGGRAWAPAGSTGSLVTARQGGKPPLRKILMRNARNLRNLKITVTDVIKLSKHVTVGPRPFSGLRTRFRAAAGACAPRPKPRVCGRRPGPSLQSGRPSPDTGGHFSGSTVPRTAVAPRLSAPCHP